MFRTCSLSPRRASGIATGPSDQTRGSCSAYPSKPTMPTTGQVEETDRTGAVDLGVLWQHLAVDRSHVQRRRQFRNPGSELAGDILEEAQIVGTVHEGAAHYLEGPPHELVEVERGT